MKPRLRKNIHYFYSVFLWLLALVIVGTGILAFHYNTQSEQLRAELKNIQSQKQYVQENLQNEYDEVLDNLDRIEIHRQNIQSELLNLTDPEGYKTPETRIREEVRKIEKLSERNELIMAELHEKIEDRDEAFEEFDKKVAAINTMIDRYEKFNDQYDRCDKKLLSGLYCSDSDTNQRVFEGESGKAKTKPVFTSPIWISKDPDGNDYYGGRN